MCVTSTPLLLFTLASPFDPAPLAAAADALDFCGAVGGARFRGGPTRWGRAEVGVDALLSFLKASLSFLVFFVLVLVRSGLFYFILYIYIVIINSDDAHERLSLPKR